MELLQQEIPIFEFAKFNEVKLSNIEAEEWLRKWLETKKSGLTGKLEKMCYPFNVKIWDTSKKVASQRGEDWWPYEPSAYLYESTLKLGYEILDKELIKKAAKIIKYIWQDQPITVRPCEVNGTPPTRRHPKGVRTRQLKIAVAMGAKVIEKHFTIDRSMDGPDHRASLDPNDLAAMIRAIRDVEKALGDGVKKPTKSELPVRDVARRSLVAAKPLKAGERLTPDNVRCKRPGTGIRPAELDDAFGKTLRRDLREDQVIHWDDIADGKTTPIDSRRRLGLL